MNKILSILAIWLCSVTVFAQLNGGDDWNLPGHPGLVTKKISVDVNNADFGTASATTATTYGTGIYPVGSKIELSATPGTGYHFVKWTKGVTTLATTASYTYTMPDEDVTVRANFAPNKYTVKFVADGQTIKSETLEYGSAITAPENPTKEGYTFKKWDTEVAATVPASDVTYTAVFDINKYNVTFTIEGVEYSSSSMEFGAAITAPENVNKSGYTFSGWTIDATVPSHDVSYDATYTINQYNVKFVADGATVKEGKQDYASAITAPEDPVKEGYTFRGWNPAVAAAVPANDVTYTAIFDINKYNVVFTVEGEEYSKSSLEFGAPITSPAVPTKTGYTFSGWDPDATVPSHDVSYDGKFNINSYKVIFNADNGTENIESTLEYGSAITAPEAPTKTGYTFNGWTPSVDGATVPANDITFKANWKVNSYKLSFVVDGVAEESQVDFGATITTPAAPTKEGYVFDAWTPAVAETMPAEDVTYTATWKLAMYNVTFVADGMTISSTPLEYGSEITVPADPTKEGYNFLGWNPAVDATVPAHDVTYTASFGKGAFLVKFVVDEKDYQTTSMDFGETIVLPETAPTKIGHTFAGWEGYEEGATVPAQNVTYNAVWTVNKYKVTFDVDGELNEQSLDYASAITTPENPTKTGYTFNGWTPAVAETVPANDVTYTATWKLNKYNFTLMADEKVFFTTEVEYNAEIPMIETHPEKEGYTFGGWDGEEAYTSMPAEDLTFNVKWIANKYAVTFKVAADTVKCDTLDFGTAIVLPETPVKEGYTFDGWTPVVAETVPANDVTYSASFKINKYAVLFVVDKDTVKNDTLDYGASITTPEVPMKSGYTFAGWSPEVSATIGASDIVYSATWAVNRYRVTFISDGVIIKTDSLDYSSPITVPEDPTKEGYTFTGWTPTVEGAVPSNDVTYTATWEVNKYTVTFVDGEDIIKSESLAYGSAIEVPANPTKEGYTFVGWSPDVAETMPTENVTYTATWTINTYTVTFIVDDVTVKSDTLEYGATIVAPADPTKVGFEFTGWTPSVAETVGTENLTYTATWQVPVGIKTINLSDAPNGTYYTINGMKVSKPTKAGLYIVNGVKMIIK